MKYFKNYLKIAPVSLAIWRGTESEVLSAFEYKKPILDIGCGFGEFAEAFFDQPVDMGIDIDTKDIGLCNKSRNYTQLVQADGRSLPFKNESYQTILSMSVLEHISQVDKVFSEAYRLLKPGGVFIYSVPTNEINKNLLGSLIFQRLGFPLLAEKYKIHYHKVFKHEIIRSKAWWLKQAKNAGFVVEDCQPTISRRQLHLFELCMPLAIPSQIIRRFFGYRLLFSTEFRINFWNTILKSQLSSHDYSDINIAILCRKPK